MTRLRAVRSPVDPVRRRPPLCEPLVEDAERPRHIGVALADALAAIGADPATLKTLRNSDPRNRRRGR